MKKGTITSVQILMTLIFAGYACTISFMAVFYRERGFSTTEMGLLFSGASLIGLLAQPVWGFLADWKFGKKALLVLLIPLTAASALCIPGVSGFVAVFALVLLNGFFQSGIAPLMDAIMLDVVELSGPASSGRPVSYAFLRSFATAGFAVASLATGFLIERFGVSIIFTGLAVLLMAGYPAIFFVRMQRRDDMRMPGGKTRGKSVLAQPSVLLFLAGAFLVNMAMMGGMSYMNELLVRVGGNVTHLGVIWFITCVVEYAAFFLVNGLIRRFGVLSVYVAGIAIFALKFFVLALSRQVLPVLIVQSFEGIGFTLFMVAGIEFLNRNMAPDERASILGIYSAVGGCGSLAAGIFGGLLLRVMTPFGLFGVFAGLCTAALLTGLALMKVSASHGKSA